MDKDRNRKINLGQLQNFVLKMIVAWSKVANDETGRGGVFRSVL